MAKLVVMRARSGVLQRTFRDKLRKFMPRRIRVDQHNPPINWIGAVENTKQGLMGQGSLAKNQVELSFSASIDELGPMWVTERGLNQFFLKKQGKDHTCLHSFNCFLHELFIKTIA